MECKICGDESEVVLDLGSTPLANSLTRDRLELDRYPLALSYCSSCSNLQLTHFVDAETLYKEYFYVTPDSSTLSKHYEYLVNFLTTAEYLSRDTKVIEVGSNAGQLLEILDSFAEIAVGVEPASNIVSSISDKGLNVVNNFFNSSVSQEIKQTHGEFDLVLARHCFAHNENPGEMIEAANLVLNQSGVMIVENAYALNTVLHGEFDQIYHEHMYYYTINSLNALFDKYGFEIFDASIGSIHGGSIIAVAGRKGEYEQTNTLRAFASLERICFKKSAILDFANRSKRTIDSLKNLITELKDDGNSIHCYGATAKGNTLLNCLSINTEHIDFCVDSTESKQGRLLPGSAIPIISEAAARSNPPDFYFLTAWNYKDEIINKVRSSGNYTSRFIIPFPSPHIV